MLVLKGRMRLDEAPRDWRRVLLAIGLQEVPIAGEIAMLAPELDLHRDPADRFIVATTLALGATLVTADRHLLAWPSPLPRLDAAR